jgi:broad specificity phosphatase PhoE
MTHLRRHDSDIVDFGYRDIVSEEEHANYKEKHGSTYNGLTHCNFNKAKEIISIIVSHNTRIQCLVDLITGNLEKNKIRFKNCAILKLELTYKCLRLSMVYEGELSIDEKHKMDKQPYYVASEQETNDIEEYSKPTKKTRKWFGTRKRNEESRSVQHVKFKIFIARGRITEAFKIDQIPPDTKYTFLMMRHGQAEHNVGTFGAKLDTSVTVPGCLQAVRAGKALKLYLEKSYFRSKHISNSEMFHLFNGKFFVSDLTRTYQTLSSLMVGLDIDNYLNTNRLIPVVLPCSSELSKKGVNGNCDITTSNAFFLTRAARENYSSILIKDGVMDDNPNGLDWGLYNIFYEGDTRSRFDLNMFKKKKTVFRCRDTNMIALALFYLNINETHNHEGLKEYIHYSAVDNLVVNPLRNSHNFGGTRKNKKLK